MKKTICYFSAVFSIVCLMSCESGQKPKEEPVQNVMEQDASTPNEGQSGYGVKSVSTGTSGDAHQCNVCSCKQYSGGSGTSDKCSCGHERHKHYWH